MANQKLTQEELDQLQELQRKNAALVNELGTIALAEINLEERKENAEKYLFDLRETEKELAGALEEKYGAGSIDLGAGEFIPAPQPETPAEVSEEVVAE